jgi:transposase
MSLTPYFVGLDIGSEQFSAAIGTSPWKLLQPARPFANSVEGFADLRHWLQQHDCLSTQTILCMEATGVYGEALAYYLVAQGYRVAVEPPLKVKRAFAPHGHKTDAVDSQQIAEYACRFVDELHFWQPRAELLEQLQVLLRTREQLVSQRTAHQNTWRALQRKAVRTPLAEQVHQQVLAQLKVHIQLIDDELRHLIEQDPTWRQWLALLLTIPGVGLLLATQVLLRAQSTPAPLDYKSLTAHWGICPYQYQSGSSVRRPARSRQYGPALPRKLLHLAARSVSTHSEPFRQYYQRKLTEGKPKRLALNNVANKLVRVICAVLNSQTPYDPLHHSSQPLLTKS